MNWRAHLYLSEPQAQFRIGNLLPDILPPRTLSHLSTQYQRGMVQHRQIDAFTDSHPIVRRSIMRVPPPLRRYAGILVDMFYDHLLACLWSEYSTAALSEFIAEVYLGFEQHSGELPAEAALRLGQIRRGDLLGSYRERAGLERALARLGRRFRQPVELDAGLFYFEQDFAGFEGDFRAFFPELQAHVSEGARGRRFG